MAMASAVKLEEIAFSLEVMTVSANLKAALTHLEFLEPSVKHLMVLLGRLAEYS